MTDTTTTPTADGAPEPAPDAPSASPFRWRLANRPDVRFGHAAGGVAGILVAAAVVAFVVEVTGDDPTLPGVGFNLLLIAAALAAGFFVRGPVRSAAVAAIVIAVPQIWIFAIVGDGDDFGSRGDFRIILLLSVASYAVLYLLTWTRGRAVLLGLALLFAASWFVFEVAGQDAPFALDVANQAQTSGLDDPSALGGSGDKTTESAFANLIVAVVLLGAGTLLDRRGRAGAATPCLLVGSLYAVVSAVTFGIDVDDVYAGGVFVAIAGLAIGLAGSLGRRRGTSWLGAVVLFAGVLAVVAQGTGDTVSGSGGGGVFGGFALVGAAVLIAIGVLVARSLAEPVDGGEPFTPRPPKPEPTPPDEPEPALVAAGAPAAATPPDETGPEPAAGAPAAPPVTWSDPSPDVPEPAGGSAGPPVDDPPATGDEAPPPPPPPPPPP